MKKQLNTPSPKPKQRKRTFFAKFFSLILLAGNLFHSHHAHATDFPGLHGRNFAEPRKEREAAPSVVADQGTEKSKALWSAAALLARPLLFEHEDCGLFQGKKKVGNFGVFWPHKRNQPTDTAFRTYVKAEERIVNFIVERVRAGVEKNLSLYQMAQIYSFVYNTTVASGARALNALENGGMKAAQAVMIRVDRIKGMKSPLPGLAQRRKDEIKLGEGEFDIPISRRMNNGQPHTLASLQAHYNAFVSSLGEAPNKNAYGAVPETPSSQHVRGTANEPASGPI